MTIVGLRMIGETMDQTCNHNATHSTDTSTGTNDVSLDDAGIIPFADECASGVGVEEAPAQPERDSANDAFGPATKRASIADRELGLDRVGTQTTGKYACPCCGDGASRVMRVRIRQQPGWTAVCAVCAATLLARVPGTIVGGMVRPTRRRRKAMPGQVAHGFRRTDQGGYRRAS